MVPWRESVVLLCGAALFAAAPATASAFDPADAAGTAPRGAGAMRPTTALPGAPRPLRDLVPVRPAGGGLPAERSAPSPTPLPVLDAGASGAALSFRFGGFSDRLLSRMSREALRYRGQNVSRVWTPAVADDWVDTAAAEDRSAAASRVIVRSTRRAIDEELTRIARTAFGWGPALDWLQNVSLRRSPAAGVSVPSIAGSTRAGPAPSAGSGTAFRTDAGFRLDAHPALYFGARFGAVRGRIELPVRDEPVRLSFDSPVGARGRAVLSSGLPRDGQGWATLTFSFGF